VQIRRPAERAITGGGTIAITNFSALGASTAPLTFVSGGNLNLGAGNVIGIQSSWDKLNREYCRCVGDCRHWRGERNRWGYHGPAEFTTKGSAGTITAFDLKAAMDNYYGVINFSSQGGTPATPIAFRFNGSSGSLNATFDFGGDENGDNYATIGVAIHPPRSIWARSKARVV